MIENRFRHLPVVDEGGSVVGLLDISKCLNDAITKLERQQNKSVNSIDDTVKHVSSIQGASGAQVAALQALLGPLLNHSLIGNSSPTLRSLLSGKPTTIVQPSTTLREAAVLMAERLKAALVVDNSKLLGIVSFKDIMTRAIAKELPMELTDVTTIMTHNPECVTPNTTVLEALQVMHDHKFLSMPVCEENGAVVGIVDVMDVIYACGGADGWRSIFGSSLDVDDCSDTASLRSTGSRTRSVKSSKSFSSKPSSKPMDVLVEAKDERPVSKLRPGKPLISHSSETVLDVCKMLANRRGYASLLTNDSGQLVGIITDKDITKRVVARFADPSSVIITSVMTKNPICVSMNDSAMEALTIMIENRFRHLPVVDEGGSVVGLLDISKCLNDAITKLERQQNKSVNSVDDAVKHVSSIQGASE